MKQRFPITVYAVFLAIILVVLPGCTSSAGKWEDDQQNWKRAWGYPKPAEIVMKHSLYWRSPHWTREEAYFFEFQWNQDLFQQLVSKNQMRPAKLESADPWYCLDKPVWFTPKPSSEYDVWNCEEEHSCKLLQDKATKELFLYACQL